MRAVILARLLVVILALVTVGAAHAAEPIQDVDNEPITLAGGKEAAADQVKRAIMAAGSLRGWTITESGPGSLRAVFAPRNHVAEVDIDYSATMFSIRYVSSANLDYGTNRDGLPVIHRNYNRWVANLRADIHAIVPYIGDCGS